MARSGQPVTVQEKRVAAGEGMINVSVDLPEGCTIDGAVPFRIAYRSGNTEIVRLIPKVSEQSFSRPVFPISIPATFAVGRTTVEIEITCRMNAGGKRRRQGMVKVVVPLEVAREEQERNVTAVIVLMPFPSGS